MVIYMHALCLSFRRGKCGNIKKAGCFSPANNKASAFAEASSTDIGGVTNPHLLTLTGATAASSVLNVLRCLYYTPRMNRLQCIHMYANNVIMKAGDDGYNEIG